jgi:mannose-6-phosphate isomerase-like protein (cupin superfamily)
MPKPAAYRYELPNDRGNVKDIVDIWKTELLGTQVQVVRNGGETNLHAHNGVDSMWFVIGGEAAFYDEDDNKFVLGVHEMITLPSGTKYWFESVGSEPLEVLHITANDPRVVPTRTDVTAIPDRVGAIPHLKVDKLEPIEAG